MNWVDFINQGGPWALTVAAGWAVLFGPLRLAREVTDRDTAHAKDSAAKEERIAELVRERDEARAEVRAMTINYAEILAKRNDVDTARELRETQRERNIAAMLARLGLTAPDAPGGGDA